MKWSIGSFPVRNRCWRLELTGHIARCLHNETKLCGVWDRALLNTRYMVFDLIVMFFS